MAVAVVLSILLVMSLAVAVQDVVLPPPPRGFSPTQADMVVDAASALSADAVARIGDAALALGATLDTLEVNPLLADGARIEALDALATYNH